MRIDRDLDSLCPTGVQLIEHVFYTCAASTGFPNTEVRQLIDYFNTKYGW
ncbi:MAG: hypothetical protein JRI23_30695 [Deltaproteobacteria bacterium]|nr:hypothetical protein [Deltaproteobacteria bacterium]